MLNILEGFDVGAMGFGTPDAIHLLAEVLKIGFADRAVATADPAFVDVPVARLTAKSYADERRAQIDMGRAQRFQAGRIGGKESADTTHVTVADADGHVVAATHTINSLFGACVQIPGTGMIANNYMFNFDPHPGRALSIAPGKRVFTSMAPMMVVEDGRVRACARPARRPAHLPVRLPGDRQPDRSRHAGAGRRRGAAHLDRGRAARARARLFGRDRGGAGAARPRILRVPHVAGGMNAISFAPDGLMTGAACWRADGTPVGISGGFARPGVRFTLT